MLVKFIQLAEMDLMLVPWVWNDVGLNYYLGLSRKQHVLIERAVTDKERRLANEKFNRHWHSWLHSLKPRSFFKFSDLEPQKPVVWSAHWHARILTSRGMMLGRRWFSHDGGDVLRSVVGILLREGPMVACFLSFVNTKQEGTTCQSGSSSHQTKSTRTQA